MEEIMPDPTTPRVAVVTGANQGLGLALVQTLADRLGSDDVVYLTARSLARGEAAARKLGDRRATIHVAQLDVTDKASIECFARLLKKRHGGVDLVASNAAARISKSFPQAEQVRNFVATNNHGSRALYRALSPLLRSNARYVFVASSFGRLKYLPKHLLTAFNTETLTLDELEETLEGYVAATEAGTASAIGWPEWINIPSKVGQVATARIAARDIARARPDDGILINAACPGLIDTDASRPWFDDMSQAQSPLQAARPIVDLLLVPPGATEPSGALVQFGVSLSWE
ncbi:MAG: SDR family NAD(P)-dependent oxidoreductase [Dinoroseobacter sp.]|nr:SDR family NAD(P)-dependent oxidoreductase [Dinoroseobacter sp.]